MKRFFAQQIRTIRFLLMAGLLLVASILLPAMQTSAQDIATANPNALVTLLNIPLCQDVFAVAPENPAFIQPNDAVRYSWSGEPGGTARRDFVAYDFLAQSDGFNLSLGLVTIEAANPLEHTTALTNGHALPGTYNWMAVFYDGLNNAICRTNTFWLDVRVGNTNTGLFNSGNGNTGDGNTGNFNTGFGNTGNTNTGLFNSGNGNTGDGNTGNFNTGGGNSGNTNTGGGNTGNTN